MLQHTALVTLLLVPLFHSMCTVHNVPLGVARQCAHMHQAVSATYRLSKMFPAKLVVGLEIREQVTTYVQHRIAGLRNEAVAQGDNVAYQNATAIRSNTMKHMCHYFRKGQLEKLFFLFPDPHFKAANHRHAQPRRLSACEKVFVSSLL
jgi:tRNA G46 methylase TrmB